MLNEAPNRTSATTFVPLAITKEKKKREGEAEGIGRSRQRENKLCDLFRLFLAQSHVIEDTHRDEPPFIRAFFIHHHGGDFHSLPGESLWWAGKAADILLYFIHAAPSCFLSHFLMWSVAPAWDRLQHQQAAAHALTFRSSIFLQERERSERERGREEPAACCWRRKKKIRKGS